MHKFFCLLSTCAVLATTASAQDLDLPRDAVEDEAALALAMPGLAKQAIALYGEHQEPERSRYLNVLFRLQVVAGQYTEAVATLQSLTELRRAADPASALALLPFEVLTKARAEQAATGVTLKEAFGQVFRAAFKLLDDKSASEAIYWFGGDPGRARATLLAALEQQKDKENITLPDALVLIRRFHFYQDIRAWTPLADALIAEDDARRYVVDRTLLVETPDGAHIAAMVVRPRSVTQPVPTLLAFTIYADEDRDFTQARTAASRGYAGVRAYTRGKGRSPQEPVPYENDGEDVRAVIDWISKQPWSDGRVGMYGGSYSGFTQWAAAKNLHPALKTIVPYAANNPGDGLPMENNVFLLVNYAWAFYVANNKYLDYETYFDRERWDALNVNWYESGKSYRQVDSVDGTPNKWFQRWLQHPSYDRYWQDMVPYKNEFARINIPVLTITGYYDDGQQSALWYLKEHYRYNKNADHYLLIGPYDHFGTGAARKARVLRGYTIDPVAQFDTPELTFQWMDYVLRGGKRPDMLKDKINYQVMGANEWKHAPSLDQMSNETLTLYLTDAKSGDRYKLSRQRPAQPGFLQQVVDLADRQTTNNDDSYPDPIVGKEPDLSDGFAFLSEPLDESLEVSGTFSGEIKATINKRDIDVGVNLYEVLPNGELFQLSYFIGRASYARDMSVRRLLEPGKVEPIPFDKTRMVSRRLSEGSRLLVTLTINRNPYAQINYGTGKDVSDEDITDAKIPLQIDWHNDSYVRIPIWRSIDTEAGS